MGSHAYQLDIPKGIRLHKVVHTTLLKPYYERSAPQIGVDESVDKEIEYGVEDIIDSVRRKGKFCIASDGLGTAQKIIPGNC